MAIKDTIYVKSDFTDLPALLCGYKDVFCIYDKSVKTFAEEIESRCDIRASFEIDADEYNKVFETVVDICRFLLDNNAGRDAFVLTVGGGLTSDMGGFAASIYKRGVRFAYVPTTLLAQVDAAIGGKTGVNLDSYKNIIGTIIQPAFTYVNAQTLSSLPRRDFLSGAAEMLKTFIIEDNGNFDKAVSFLSGEITDPETLRSLIEAAAMVKAGVVTRDEFERGERRHLNLGHTFAHAIEWYEHANHIPNPCSHGEAVAIGIVQAAYLSEKLGKCESGLAEKIKSDFIRCGLPVDMKYPMAEMTDAIFKDKKAVDGGVNFVVIKHIGEVEVCFIDRSKSEIAFAPKGM